jgi:hypothetical protein
MGWKALMRSLEASARRSEREAQRQARASEREAARRYRQLQEEQARLDRAFEKAQARRERAEEQRRAQCEVDLHQASFDVLLSIYKQCADEIDWQSLHTAAPPNPPSTPAKPAYISFFEDRARRGLEQYRLSFFDWLFRQSERKRQELQEHLEAAKQRDQEKYREAIAKWQAMRHEAVQEHSQAVKDWEETRALAAQILAGSGHPPHERPQHQGDHPNHRPVDRAGRLGSGHPGG